MDVLIQGIFMAQVINEMDVPSHSFVFHGTGERYFLICVVNVLLTIITLGIYLPCSIFVEIKKTAPIPMAIKIGKKKVTHQNPF